MTNERNTEPSKQRHLSTAPFLELHEFAQDTQQGTNSSTEPSQPETVTFRVERQALNMLIALAAHDQTNPAEQVRTAVTLYINQRLGSKAVEYFISERERQLMEIHDFVSQVVPDAEQGK